MPDKNFVYTDKEWGGRFKVRFESLGAGEVSGHILVSYQCLDTNKLFTCTQVDFKSWMRNTGSLLREDER